MEDNTMDAKDLIIWEQAGTIATLEARLSLMKSSKDLLYQIIEAKDETIAILQGKNNG